MSVKPAVFVCLLSVTAAARAEIFFVESVVSQATPVADIVTRGRVDAEAPRRLKIETDDTGRIVNIKSYRDGVLSTRSGFDAAEVRIEYPNGQEIRTYWNEKGEPDTVWRVCY